MKTSKNMAGQSDLAPDQQKDFIMREKAIEAYKRNCRKYTILCFSKYPDCSSDCEYLKDFITDLDK